MRTLLIAIIAFIGIQVQANDSEIDQTFRNRTHQFISSGEGYWCYQDKKSAYQQAFFMMKQNAAAQCPSGQARQITPASEVTGPCSVEVRAGFVCR